MINFGYVYDICIYFFYYLCLNFCLEDGISNYVSVNCCYINEDEC